MSIAQSLVADSPASLSPGGALFCWENWALSRLGGSIHSVTSTGASAGAFRDVSADNLLTEALDLPWRSGPVGQIVSGEISIVIMLDSPRSIDFVGFPRSNLREPWAVEFYRGDPALTTAAYASGWRDPIVRAALTDFGWYDLLWSLGPPTRKLDALQDLNRLEVFHLADQIYSGIRYVKLRFDVSRGVNGNGFTYIQAAVAQVGKSFRPIVNIPLGWNMVPISRTVKRRTVGNSLTGRRQATGRQFSFSLNWLRDQEAWDRILGDWQTDLGDLALLFAWAEPLKRRYYYRQAGLWQLDDGGQALSKAMHERLTDEFTLTEA